MRTLFIAACTAIGLTLSFPLFSADAQNEELQGMVDELDTLTKKARKQRAADRWLMNAMEDLVTKYNWPWRTELMLEDFSDGDYSQNPAWQVSTGQFWVDGRLGLRSRSHIEPERKKSERKQDLGQALLGSLLEQAMQKQGRRDEPRRDNRYGPAEIKLPLQIPAVFAAQAEFSIHNAPSETSQFEFSLYQDREGDSGYRLIMYIGDKSTLELISRRNNRTTVIDSVDIDQINDGSTHEILWRRSPEGQMEILLDEKRLIRSRDHSFRHPFTHFAITNRGGDFAVAGVSLYGSK